MLQCTQVSCALNHAFRKKISGGQLIVRTRSSHRDSKRLLNETGRRNAYLKRCLHRHSIFRVRINFLPTTGNRESPRRVLRRACNEPKRHGSKTQINH